MQIKIMSTFLIYQKSISVHYGFRTRKLSILQLASLPHRPNSNSCTLYIYYIMYLEIYVFWQLLKLEHNMNMFVYSMTKLYCAL